MFCFFSLFFRVLFCAGASSQPNNATNYCDQRSWPGRGSTLTAVLAFGCSFPWSTLFFFLVCPHKSFIGINNVLFIQSSTAVVGLNLWWLYSPSGLCKNIKFELDAILCTALCLSINTNCYNIYLYSTPKIQNWKKTFLLNISTYAYRNHIINNNKFIQIDNSTCFEDVLVLKHDILLFYITDLVAWALSTCFPHNMF